jgi:methyltransferase of ATP-grasp peptide maturase system
MHASDVADSGGLRRRLAAELAAGGHIRSAAWRAAVAAVPRHEFLPEFFTMLDGPGPTRWEPVTAQGSGQDAWLTLAYTDDSLVTQLDGKLLPHQVDGPVPGNPTSSATMPRLVARMWEDLNVAEGDRVLEIGTGTGYSTALGCQRLGDDQVTSVEVDPVVAARAAAALARAGYAPTLMTGDGLDGHPTGAPYDRVIATCAVRAVPPPWVEQTRPGGIILVTLSGWLHASGLIRLTVTGPDTAEGNYLPGDISFMMARPHAAPPIGVITDQMRTGGTVRTAHFAADLLGQPGVARLLAQLAAPTAQHIRLALDDDPLTDYIVDTTTRSWAAITDTSGGRAVRQGGPTRLWDAIEAAWDIWQRAGRLDLSDFTVQVTPDAQTVRLATPDGPYSWTLPGA